jgi:hypothetical protein
MHPRTDRSHPNFVPTEDAEMHKTLLAAAIALTVSAGSLAAAPAAYKEPLDAQTLDTIRSDFRTLMELANRHDFQALHEMFWQSPSALLVAKNAIPSEGNWAGFWGNEAIDQKLHDISTRPGRARTGLFEAQGRRPDARYCGVLCPHEYHGLLCGAGRNAQAIPDDYKLDKSWQRLEGRVRNHPTSASGTRPQGLASTEETWDIRDVLNFHSSKKLGNVPSVLVLRRNERGNSERNNGRFRSELESP